LESANPELREFCVSRDRHWWSFCETATFDISLQGECDIFSDIENQASAPVAFDAKAK
jgi:hypothetical protein